MEDLLIIENLSKAYNGLQVLQEISFSVEKNSIIALTGENSTGKTTLFNLINGFDSHDNGNIIFDGKNISQWGAIARSRAGIGRLFQNSRVFKNMRVLDILLASCFDNPGERILNYFVNPASIKSFEKTSRNKAAEVLNYLRLLDKSQDFGGSLSHGEKKLLSLGMLMMNNYKLILLDEPFAGLNAKMIDKISDTLSDLARNGQTFIIIEHNIEKVSSISNQVLILKEGRIIENNKINNANNLIN
ncbi:MAG: ATP-binding cassette domain-containing protein [Bacteroidales bacterium]|nr:ATP-binding cassette domain-containing protein [Bacteroidales bacterium]